MLSYIQENYSRPIRLADLAADVHLRPSYACSLFSTTLGMPFHRYLEQFRLVEAKALLRDPVTRVSEVAYAVGYTNPNHFRNVFTARVGLSPSAWRESRASGGSSSAP
jgi:AraC-like DNA-binding protein